MNPYFYRAWLKIDRKTRHQTNVLKVLVPWPAFNLMAMLLFPFVLWLSRIFDTNMNTNIDVSKIWAEAMRLASKRPALRAAPDYFGPRLFTPNYDFLQLGTVDHRSRKFAGVNCVARYAPISMKRAAVGAWIGACKW